VRIANAEFMHVSDRVADVFRARPALANALGHEARAPVQIELPYVSRMRGIGEEGERAYVAPGSEPDFQKPGRIHPPGHLPFPEPHERMPHPCGANPECHPPA
jgi:hypothetical protein